MKPPPEWLLEFQKSVYSQTGEDGTIENVLDLLPAREKWCVEVGASDGIEFSNTRNLIEHAGYSAVLIEGSEPDYRQLRSNYASHPNVITMNASIGLSEADNLDAILSDTPIPCDFDFLSIDVDGNDYHIWNSLSQYEPKNVCIEFNPTIPTEVRFVQVAEAGVNQGASLLALVELGKTKSYELVSVLDFNAIFVRSEYFPLFRIENNSPYALRKSLDSITYIFSGFDGTVFLQGSQMLLWHGIKMHESRMQPLPRILRRYPPNYNRLQRLLHWVYPCCDYAVSNPFPVVRRKAVAKVRKRMSLRSR